jgi:hypothetical protein
VQELKSYVSTKLTEMNLDAVYKSISSLTQTLLEIKSKIDVQFSSCAADRLLANQDDPTVYGTKSKKEHRANYNLN